MEGSTSKFPLLALENIFSDPPTVSVSHSPDSAAKMTLTCKVVMMMLMLMSLKKMRSLMILFQVDAVPAADVTWWREGGQIENKDEFHIGEDNYDNYHIYDNEDNYTMKMLRMVMTMMRRGGG